MCYFHFLLAVCHFFQYRWFQWEICQFQMSQNPFPFLIFWYEWNMNICICSTVVRIIFIKNDPRIDTVSSTLHFGILMILFNCRCKDSFLKVLALEGIFSKYPFNMWISKLSNAFLASLYITVLYIQPGSP